MKFRRCFFLCLVLGCSMGAATTTSVPSPRLPFAFIENRGQVDARVRYVGNGPESKALFLDGGITLLRGSAVSSMHFAGGAAHPRIQASAPMPGKTNYLFGSDARQWLTDLPMFNSLQYDGVWPGVAIRFRGEGAGTRVEYAVDSPEAVSKIRLRYDGDAKVQSDGTLVVSVGTAEFREERPSLCAGPGSAECGSQGDFVKLGDGSIGITLSANVSASPITLDPRFLFSGYFGGSSQTNITGVAINSYYNTVVTGWTVATDLPTSGGAQVRSGGGIDAFVAAFSPAGGTLIYCTYLGGSGADEASGIAVDTANNTYVTGWTSSSNFPVSNAVQSHLSGARDAFVTKLNAAGNALLYSTYLGGSGVDTGNAIAVDSTGAAVVIGDTTSTNLSTTSAAAQPRLRGSQDVFLAKFTPAGTALQFLTYFGGSASDHGATVALDSSASIFIGGSTFSTNFPAVNAAQPQSGGGQDGFVAKLSPTCSVILFSTYLGGSGGGPGSPESVNGVVVGPVGNPIVVGTTSSTNFPVLAGASQPNFGGGQTDGFIARYNGITGALQKSTFLGGSSDDGVNAVATDLRGNTYATGYTTSTDFPTLNPIQSANAGGMDAFVIKMSNQMIYSTYVGGNGNDSANTIAVDSLTSVVIAGTTGSSNLPATAFMSGPQGGPLSAFATKIAPNFTLNLAAAPTFYFDVWHNSGYNGPNVTLNATTFGNAGDIPLMADWDGSGNKKIGVFRNGTWLLDTNGNGVFDAGDQTVTFGQAGDIPVTGDWNGTGRIKLGVFRQGVFILDLSGHLSGTPTGLADQTFSFGLASDTPVVADWNHSGTTKVGVFRNGQWLVDFNGDQVFNGSDKTYTYGQTGDIPVTGDWDSSGVPNKIGVFRHGLWILDYDGDNAVSGVGQWELYVGFGSGGYLPLVR